MKCLKWQNVTLQLTWMSFLQNCEVCFNQERLPITYHNFRLKSLVRPKSKSPNWQESQPIMYKAKFSQRDNVYLVDLKYNITYQNIRGKTKVRPIFIPWNAQNGKKVALQLTWMSFLQNRKVCFNQEKLPITYYNSCHQSLVIPKSKSRIEKDLNPLASKTNFSREENMPLIDVKFNITYQNNQEIIKVRPLLRT